MRVREGREGGRGSEGGSESEGGREKDGVSYICNRMKLISHTPQRV